MTRFGSSSGLFLLALAAASRPGLARAEPGVFLEIQGATEGVRVLQRNPSGRAEAVCAGACQRNLDPRPEYLLETGGPLIPAPLSARSLFTLPPDRPRVVLDVTPVSKLRPAAGWSLLGGGIATVLVSTGVLMRDDPGGPTSNAGPPSRYWLAAYPLGVVATIVGGYLLGTSSPRVTSDSGAVIQ